MILIIPSLTSFAPSPRMRLRRVDSYEHTPDGLPRSSPARPLSQMICSYFQLSAQARVCRISRRSRSEPLRGDSESSCPTRPREDAAAFSPRGGKQPVTLPLPALPERKCSPRDVSTTRFGGGPSSTLFCGGAGRTLLSMASRRSAERVAIALIPPSLSFRVYS